MKNLFPVLLLLTFYASPLFSQGEHGRRSEILELCENKYGGVLTVGDKITKVENGVKKVCLSNVTCQESSNDGHIDILQTLEDTCISEKEFKQREISLFLKRDDDCITNCGNRKMKSGDYYVEMSTSNLCYKPCQKASHWADKYFEKGKGFLNLRKKKYDKWDRRCNECLWGARAARTCPKKGSGCFKNMPGVIVKGGNTVVIRDGDIDCAYSTTSRCLSHAEIEAIERDYYEEDDCANCSEKERRRRERAERRAERKENRTGNWGEQLGHILNPLAYFGASAFSSYQQSKALRGMAEACTNAYGSYTGTINNQNNLINTENATVRDPGGYPLLDYKNARTPDCNGYPMGGFAGLGGGLGGFGGGLGGGYGYNPMFPHSYYGGGMGLNGINPYGGMGGMFGLNVGIGGGMGGGMGAYQQYPYWQQGGYYPGGAYGGYAGANGHYPYGGMYGGAGGNFGNPYSPYGPYSGAGGYASGGYGQYGYGVSQRTMMSNPQNYYYQSQLQQGALARDAYSYGNAAYTNMNMGYPYQTPMFSPYQ